MFHKNVHVLGRLIVKYGAESIQIVSEGNEKHAWDTCSMSHRCQDIEGDKEESKIDPRNQPRLVEGCLNFT